MKAAIVTGVSRGLGASLAAALLQRGWSVTGVGRRAAPELAGAAFRLVQCDLSDTAAIRPTMEPVLRRLARDNPSQACLINNAAVAGPAGVLGALADAEVAASLAVNLVAPALLCNLFVEVLAGSPAARRIINVSSGAAQSALSGGAVYSVAKAGLEMLTLSIAAETANSGVEAISLRPGIIDTDMQLFMRSQPKERLPSVDMFRDFHASGQLVQPDTVAARVVSRLVEGPVENGRVYRYAEL
jgi:benzil reductase ((S)-benzoin forming)